MSNPIVELLELEVMNPIHSKASNQPPFYFQLESDDEFKTSIFNEKSLDEISVNLKQSIANSIKSLVDLADNSSIQPLLPTEKELAIQSKLDENNIQSNAVSDLWILRSGIQEIDVLIELGELSQALSNLENVRSKLELFENSYKGTGLVGDINSHVNEILKTIRDRVDRGWKEAIVFEEVNGGSNNSTDSTDDEIVVTINQSIDDLSLSTLYETIQLLPNGHEKIDLFLKSIEKQIFNPILELKIKSVEVINNKLKLMINDDIKLTVYDITDILTESIKFLHENFSPLLLSNVISKNFSSYITHELSNHTLPRLFPNDSSQVVLFKRELTFVNEFEHFLSTIKWINNTDLSDWVNDFINEWVAYRKSIYLDELRDVIFEDIKLERLEVGEVSEESKDLNKEGVEPAPIEPANDEWNWNDEGEDDDNDGADDGVDNDNNNDGSDDDDWGWGDDKSNSAGATSSVAPTHATPDPATQSSTPNHPSLTAITITSTVNKLTKLITKFTSEVESQCAITKHISDLIDLYISLSTLLYEDLPLIISYNDLITLSGNLETFPQVSQEDSEKLKQLANHQLTKILEENQIKISSYLSTANRFTDCTGINKDNCEGAISKSMSLMRGLAEELKTYTNYPVTVQLLGSILETAVVTIIESIEYHQDISEEESQQLSNIIGTITTLEDIFENPAVERKENQSFAAFYVPSWIKLQYLNEILLSKLVDIQFMFNNNALVDFTSTELTNLIKALFVDSEYRRRALDEITR